MYIYKVVAFVLICLFLFVEDHMSTIVARTGRQRQRYEDNFRLVSG